MLGGAAPSIVGVLLLYCFASATERRDFGARLVRFRNIQQVWCALILLGFPAVALLGLAANAWLGGAQPGYKGLQLVAAQPQLLIPLIVQGLVTGPLLEELRWRGFALDRLTRRWRLLAASLVLGIIWWPWEA